jgi:hypothetical protein
VTVAVPTPVALPFLELFDEGQVWEWTTRRGRRLRGTVLDRPFLALGKWWLAMQIDDFQDPKLVRASKVRDHGRRLS